MTELPPKPPLEQLQLHDQAKQMVEEEAARFLTSLMYGAKFLAHSNGNEMVLKEHVRETLRILRRGQDRPWWKEFTTIVGGAFFGAFVPGMINELSSPTIKPLNIVIYIGFGFVGVVVSVYGLWSSRSL